MLAAPSLPELFGTREPTHKSVPAYEFSHGQSALDLMEVVGQPLYGWQGDYLMDGLGVSTREKWSAFECELEVARQNGKSAIYEARCLTGIYVLRERDIVYSAHRIQTVKDAQARMVALIEANAELVGELARNGIKTGNNDMSLNFRTGQRIRFMTRTKGGGRGLTGDCTILDEDQDLTFEHIAALVPAMAARAKRGNPQLWYGGSAGGPESAVKGSLLRRAANGDPGLLCYRWAADPDADENDPHVWARHNPSMGLSLTIEHTAKEQRALGETFGQERLSKGNYPRPEGEEWVIPRPVFERAEDRDSQPVGKVAFAVEVAHDRSRTSIAIAGWRADGSRHLELVANEPGTRWSVEWLRSRMAKHENLGVVGDPATIGTLVGPLRDAGIELHALTSTHLTQAWTNLFDGMTDEAGPRYRHRGDSRLYAGLSVAATRSVAGATTWRRQPVGGSASADVSGLLAVTWAAEALTMPELQPARQDPPPPPRSLASLADAYVGLGRDLMTTGF